MKRRWLIWFNVVYLAVFSLLGIPKASALPAIKCDTIPNEKWTPTLARAYAKFSMAKYGWNKSEWRALFKLWNAESHWNVKAYNHSVERWSGLHAGGVAQMLGVSPKTPAPVQIDRGLAYVKDRYGRPSVAWAHHRATGWY